ncbi:ABC transporter permease [Flavivirga aquimarina]|uniref:ABC transporter permease n=1 Tax=Flavivirga aquimarina TaxID=2027862 RepID=A0ABT8WCH2_9FLAO|nr:ABC transporter permease [Flavivirga aquimarina]MDO5970847.1 ABC transporter permease [Flavivirga aquimarina]
MIKNYFKIALRNLRKNKLYASINIFGLAIGLASCMLIGLYIVKELSYDKFNDKANRIVRVTMEYKMSNEINYAATTGTKVGPEFARTFPKIEEYTRTFISTSNVEYGNKLFNEDRILFADPSFFNIFSFNLLQGNAETILDAPNKIVLTESMAKKYFGDENPINKTITVIGKEMIVSGVSQDCPKNSQIKFDFVTQFLNLGNKVKREQWWSANWITYFLLNTGDDITQFEQQINTYMQTDAIRSQAGLEGESYLNYHMQPLLDVHLKSDLAGFEPNGNMTYIYIFIIISLLILLIASANYTNLATAQSTSRSGEIGMRKVMGASKRQVFIQFISESTTITFIAAVLALLLCVLVLPYFNSITGKAFTKLELLQPISMLLLFLFSVIVSFLAGLYPALVLSGTNVMSVLKKGFRSPGGNGILKKSLIVGQFSISVFLIIYTMVILQQMDFIQNKNLGYNKDHVVVLPISRTMLENFETFKYGLEQISGVQSVTASYETPKFVKWGDGVNVVDENGEHTIDINAMPVDLNFVNTLGMKMVAGRDFIQSDFALMDTTNNSVNYKQPYLINETLAKQIGWSPEEAIGRTIENRASGPVLGVVKDFNFSSLHEPVGPLLMFLGRNFSRNYMVRISDLDVQGTLGNLETLWNERTNGRPFNYHFLDEDYDALYQTEKRSAILFSVAAGLAIILACLGLFGLAAFSIVQRTKEIGIRKVLGANLSNIILLISKNFLVLVTIAIIIASPFAFFATKKWLQNFAYRIEPEWSVFFIPVIVTLLVTFLTVGYHSIRAAMANPIKSLRTE